MTDPDPRDLLRDLLRALGENDGARPESPKALWEQSISKVAALRSLCGNMPESWKRLAALDTEVTE